MVVTQSLDALEALRRGVNRWLLLALGLTLAVALAGAAWLSSRISRPLRELADKTSRWAMRGLIVDWRDYDRVYNEAGLIPPKDHAPVVEDWMLYDDEYERVGYATSFMYSPMLQRHIAIARVRPDLAKLGTKVNLEFTVDHHYEQVAAHVARLPLYNPERKTA